MSNWNEFIAIAKQSWGRMKSRPKIFLFLLLYALLASALTLAVAPFLPQMQQRNPIGSAVFSLIWSLLLSFPAYYTLFGVLTELLEDSPVSLSRGFSRAHRNFKQMVYLILYVLPLTLSQSMIQFMGSSFQIHEYKVSTVSLIVFVLLYLLFLLMTVVYSFYLFYAFPAAATCEPETGAAELNRRTFYALKHGWSHPLFYILAVIVCCIILGVVLVIFVTIALLSGVGATVVMAIILGPIIALSVLTWGYSCALCGIAYQTVMRRMEKEPT